MLVNNNRIIKKTRIIVFKLCYTVMMLHVFVLIIIPLHR